jgi:hypothetical protein
VPPGLSPDWHGLARAAFQQGSSKLKASMIIFHA